MSISPHRDALAASIEHAQNVILLADDAQRFVYANPAATRLLGYTRDELLRMSVWDLTPAPDVDAGEHLWKQFIADGTQSGLYRVARKDGEVRVCRVSAVANVAPGLHLSDLHDVTALIRAEEAQRERAAEQELLASEMHRRTRNVLATVLAVLHGEAASARLPAVRRLVDRVAPRVRAMAEATRLARETSAETPRPSAPTR